jgi:hypothetical protein
MKTIILAAAVASIAMTGMAYADASDQMPGVHGRSIEYGESPSGRNIGTTQPSGGKVADELAAPTGNISGSVTGAANMNGPLRNGQPLDPFWERSNGIGPYSPYND